MLLPPQIPYPDKYDECRRRGSEEKQANARPEIKDKISNLDQYNNIIVGYPIWHGDLPMIMYTFFESNNFDGKNIYPFVTHEGSGIAHTDEKIQNTVPNAKVADGLEVRGIKAQALEKTTKAKISTWLDLNKLIK